MKKALAISRILSWINLIVGSILTLAALYALLTLFAAALVSVVLIGCIVLHSYAAMQLHKSFVNPAMPLSKQTPVGIRMMGYISLFFAIMLFSDGIYLLQNTHELLNQVKIPPQIKEADFSKAIRGTSVFIIIFSLSVIINVVLNFRLLKAYTQLHQDNLQ